MDKSRASIQQGTDIQLSMSKACLNTKEEAKQISFGGGGGFHSLAATTEKALPQILTCYISSSEGQSIAPSEDLSK